MRPRPVYTLPPYLAFRARRAVEGPMRLLALALGDGRCRFSSRPGEGSEDASIRYSALVHDARVVWPQTTSTEWVRILRAMVQGDRFAPTLLTTPK